MGPSNFRLALADKAQRLQEQIDRCDCTQPRKRCHRCEEALRELSHLTEAK